MSLINTQLISMRQCEVDELQARLRNDIEPAIARGDNVKKNTAAKATAEQRIRILIREIAKMQSENDAVNADRARVEAEREAAAAAKEAEAEARRPKALLLSCCDCNSNFPFEVEQQRKFKRNGWSDPVRCDDCRAERKANRLEPITLECCDCHGELIYTVRQQINAKENGWEPPKRCRDCKDKKSAAIASAKPKGTLINCGDCRKDFTFTVGAQKFHQEKGFKDPKWCPDCRKKRRSDGASTHSSRTPVNA